MIAIEEITDAAREALLSLDELISSSGGVYGLHLNGDQAPWDELCVGGRYEGWLIAFDRLRAALEAALGEK